MRTKRNDFSLIELLVVIVIIVILVALLLPVLSKARGKAMGVKCLGHLMQMGLAQAQYADMYNGLCPPVFDTLSSSITPNKNWTEILSDEKFIPRLIVGKTERSSHIAMCPSFGSPVFLQRARTYGRLYRGKWDSFAIGSGMIDLPRVVMSGTTYNASRVSPSEFWYIADTVQNLGNVEQWYSYSPGGNLGFRHSRRSNILYADGHTGSISYDEANVEIFGVKFELPLIY